MGARSRDLRFRAEQRRLFRRGGHLAGAHPPRNGLPDKSCEWSRQQRGGPVQNGPHNNSRRMWRLSFLAVRAAFLAAERIPSPGGQNTHNAAATKQENGRCSPSSLSLLRNRRLHLTCLRPIYRRIISNIRRWRSGGRSFRLCRLLRHTGTRLRQWQNAVSCSGADY